MAKNLWGDLSSLAVVRTPKTILEEQASVLSEATGGLLVGRIYDLTSLRGTFSYDLDVVVPALNNYRYSVLRVDHSMELYPLRLLAERPPVDLKISGEDEFEDAIEKILSSPEVRSALSHLKSQVSEP